jgi:ABC-type polysaccharide/polyol phosphate transport system ATPase subunit
VTDDAAVVIDHVSKDYRVVRGSSSSLKESVLRRHRGDAEVFHALRDVSLTIPRGTTFGLVGHNGSGKSTLLKLVAGIFEPNAGSVRVNGRVTALLELGAGFHPDLTGRENVFLSASIHGVGSRQAQRQIDNIKEFSGLGDFFEAPVKTYSSGMFVRLGFAVSVHLEPDILIIDEVVAVGDEQFQRQCFDHLHALRRKGTTILFVTHSLAVVEQLAHEAAWIDHGRLRREGTARDVIDAYLGQVNREERERQVAEVARRTVQVGSGSAQSGCGSAQAGSGSDEQSPAATGPSPETPADPGTTGTTGTPGAEPHPDDASPTPEPAVSRWGSREAEVLGVDFLDADGRATSMVEFGEPLTIRVRYVAHESLDGPNFGLAAWSEQGWPIGAPNTRLAGTATGTVQGEGRIDFHMPRCVFVPGRVTFSAAITDDSTLHTYDWWDKAFELKVVPSHGIAPTGLIEVPGTWQGPAST